MAVHSSEFGYINWQSADKDDCIGIIMSAAERLIEIEKAEGETEDDASEE